MKTLQQIFDLMIQHQRYVAEDHSGYNCSIQSMYMCNSLKNHSDDLITRQEASKALDAIDNYIYTALGRDSGNCTLYSALQIRGYKCDDDALMAVYQNWAKRPNLRIQRK